MRPAKVPSEVVVRMVWESLCERMDPETHLGLAGTDPILCVCL